MAKAAKTRTPAKKVVAVVTQDSNGHVDLVEKDNPNVISSRPGVVMEKYDMLFENVKIKPLKKVVLSLRITGQTPYMQAKFSSKSKHIIEEKHRAGDKAKNKKSREARDFSADCEGARYKMKDNGSGIPCSAFRNAMISACRIVGFKMTIAKLSIFIKEDGFDVEDGTPLVRLHGKHEETIMPVRNATGVVDLRARPQWREWHAILNIHFDGDQFSPGDIFNLMTRVGQQVGIGEGRHDSKSSAGIGLGTFNVEMM